MRNVSYCPAGGRSSLLAAVLVSVRVLSLPLILQAVSFWSVPAAAQDAPVAPVRVIKDGPGSVAALLGSDIGGLRRISPRRVSFRVRSRFPRRLVT